MDPVRLKETAPMDLIVMDSLAYFPNLHEAVIKVKGKQNGLPELRFSKSTERKILRQLRIRAYSDDTGVITAPDADES